MRRRRTPLLIALLLALGLGAAGLSGCSSDGHDGAEHADQEQSGGDTTEVAVAEDLPQDVIEILSEYGVEATDVRAAITGLDQVDQPRPLEGVQASVRVDQVLFTVDSGEVAVPIPGDEVYVSIAPYVESTHDCFFHALGGCQGELVGEELQVTITDDAGAVLVDEQLTTYTNGFVGFWLPKDTTGTITVTDDDTGLSGEAPFDSTDEGPTCITTLQLT